MVYTLNIRISGQILGFSTVQSVNGTVDIFQCAFSFDDSWEAFPARQAIFRNCNDLDSYVVSIVDSAAVIPWEVLAKQGNVNVAVVGTNTDGQVQRTNTIPIICQKSTLQSGVNGIEPTPDQYAQFIAQVQEMISGASVLSVNGMTGTVTLDAEDVGALSDEVTIPTKTSDLVNDSGFITSAPVTSVNSETGAVTLTASDVGALPDSTVIPTKTSQLTNDSGYITSAPVTSVNGQTGAVTVTVPTKTSDLQNDSGFITNVPVISVNSKTGAVVLDADDVGALPDTTTAADLGAYVKPSGGIPKTDLASSVQTSLGKADTALQTAPVTSVNGATGAVVITNATTSAAGLMSATDKAHLDAVFADYSSALTALGV